MRKPCPMCAAAAVLPRNTRSVVYRCTWCNDVGTIPAKKPVPVIRYEQAWDENEWEEIRQARDRNNKRMFT